MHSRFPGSQSTCHQRDSPHPVPFSPGSCGSTPHLQVRVWCVERLPQHPSRRRGSAPHHLHHSVGPLSLLCCATGLHRIRGRLQPTLRWIRHGLSAEDQMCWRHPDVDPLHCRQLLPGGGLAGYLWAPWRHPEPIQICLCPGHRGVCKLWNHPTSVRPCHKSIEAILNFPAPKNITDMRSWFGLVAQVSYAFASAERMKPFCQFLKPGTKFQWNDALNTLFQETKDLIINEINHGVEIFDKSRPTCLATDWCKDGIGFWLLQKHCTCPTSKPFCCPDGWKITLVGSRFTSGAESRYAPIEGEALAVVDALDRARHFVIGCPDLTVAVDHKPLLKVLGDRRLDDIPNPRLRNLKEKTLRYRFKMVHIPGARHIATDTLSRHPVSEPMAVELPDDVCAPCTSASLPRDILTQLRADEETSAPLCSYADSVDNAFIQSVSWDDVRLATSSDPDMVTLLNFIEDGFPALKNDLPSAIRPYHQYRTNLSSFDGVAL